MEQIRQAIAVGAKLYGSISGGKDGQAMVKVLHLNKIPLTGLLHCDLGRIEWPQSIQMCFTQSVALNIPLQILQRRDKVGLLDHWKNRLKKLMGTGKPFWSSAMQRYCTSDLKREPTDNFLRNCGHKFIISCEGIRSDESKARAKKQPLSIRKRLTSTYYNGMTVEQAIANYNPAYRLALTWYPIFYFSLTEVLITYGMTIQSLQAARKTYNSEGIIPADFPFHPAYAMGNDRVSCMFCVLGSLNDLQNAARQDPELLNELIAMEEEGGATFKNKWSLKQLLTIKK